MKITSALALFTAILCFSSCTDSPTENVVEEGKQEQELETATAAEPVSPATTQLPADGSQNLNATVTNTEVIPAGNAPVPNPPHGQPGHVCETPGANASSTMTAAPQPAMNPVQINTPQAVPAAGGASARLNPAHGDPGHNCSVAVGAPLPN